jgi:hypothetical protein
MALKLFGEVDLDGSGFQRGLSRLGASAASNLKNFVIGAFGIYGVQQAIAKTIESADELVVASKRLDLTVEQLQVMRQAALRARIEFSYLEKAIEGINIAREDALKGGKAGAPFMEAFGKLGITKEMLQSQTGGSLMMGQLRTAVLQQNVADLDASIRKITPGFRNFGELIPFLKQDFVALQKEMEDMGAIMAGTTARELKYFKDEMGVLTKVITNWLAPKLVVLGEVVLWLIGQIQESGSFLKSFFKNQPIQMNHVNSFWEGLWSPPFKYDTSKTFGGALNVADAAANVVAAKNAQDAADLLKMIELAGTMPPEPPPEGGKASKLNASHEKSGDSLVAVGNFLGTSRGGISGLQEQLVRHTERTANNTSAMLIELRKHNPGHSVTGSAFGLSGATIWPST